MKPGVLATATTVRIGSVVVGGLALLLAFGCRPSPAHAAPPAAAVAPVTPVADAAKSDAASALPVDKQLDLALEHYYAKRYVPAAVGLYALFRTMPETELRRDTVEFYFASSLALLHLTEAAIEHYFDIISGRRTPDLVARSIGALDELVRRRVLAEDRLIDEVLFGNQFGDLPGETAEFVEYYQGLGELRRGFAALGHRRLEGLSLTSRYYGWKSRYALAVERLARGNDEGAETLLRTLIDDEKTPGAVRNDARAAMARQLYEKKKFTEAFDLYSKIDSPLETQDLILVEKAWTKVAERDERRALGMVVGLGAPVYHLVFAPERSLITATALDRLCQFRAAHLSVLDFRRQYQTQLEAIREHKKLSDDRVLRQAALSRADLVAAAPWRERLAREQARIPALLDRPLREHLALIYQADIARADAAIARGLDRALDKVSEQLLAVNEQMTILDYEIGVGLFKGVFGENRGRAEARVPRIPVGGNRVYHHFTGEYWSDEINDFEVLVGDRCLR